MVPKLRDLGELALEDARAAAACFDGAEAEEAHARGAFALELAIELLPQALSARCRQTRDCEILEHRLLVPLDDIGGEFGLAAVLGLQEPRFVEEHVASGHAGDAGGTAARVALDPRLGHLVETELLDRLAVQVLRPPRELQEYRVVRCDLIEFLAGELTLVIGELRGRPAAEVVDPSTIWRRLRLCGDCVKHLLARVHAVEAELHRPVGAFLLEVGVVVDEAGHHRLATQVDALRVGPRHPGDVDVAADSDDARAAHRDRLSNLEGVVNGYDFSISKNEIRGRLLRLQR